MTGRVDASLPARSNGRKSVLVGTFSEQANQCEAQRMTAKAQEVAIDRLLVDRFKGGDEAAFGEIVSRYRAKIYALVLQLLRNREDAEEVTQDAFIRAHRALAKFRGESSFSTWLYQIATNLARNRYWYWWRRKRNFAVSFDAPINGDTDLTLADVIPAEVQAPDDVTVNEEFVGRIAAGMERLSSKHREVLVLRNVRNLAYEDIAQILGISVGTVKSRIARAREALREQLGEDFL